MATRTQLLLPWQQRNLRHALYMNKRRNRRQRPEIHKCCNEVSALILLVMLNSWLFPFVFETARALSIWKDCRLFRLQADLWELYEKPFWPVWHCVPNSMRETNGARCKKTCIIYGNNAELVKRTTSPGYYFYLHIHSREPFGHLMLKTKVKAVHFWTVENFCEIRSNINLDFVQLVWGYESMTFS